MEDRILTKADFEERIKLLEEARAKKVESVTGNSKTIAILAGFIIMCLSFYPLLFPGIYNPIRERSILIGTGAAVSLIAVLAPPLVRSLLIFALSICMAVYASLTIEYTYLSFSSIVIPFILVYTGARVHASFPRYKLARDIAIVGSLFGIVVILIIFQKWREIWNNAFAGCGPLYLDLEEGLLLILPGILPMIGLMSIYSFDSILRYNNDPKKAAAGAIRMVYICGTGLFLIISIYLTLDYYYCLHPLNGMAGWAGKFWYSEFFGEMLRAIMLNCGIVLLIWAGLADFVIQILFTRWVRRVDIELSRMRQEIAE